MFVYTNKLSFLLLLYLYPSSACVVMCMLHRQLWCINTENVNIKFVKRVLQSAYCAHMSARKCFTTNRGHKQQIASTTGSAIPQQQQQHTYLADLLLGSGYSTLRCDCRHEIHFSLSFVSFLLGCTQLETISVYFVWQSVRDDGTAISCHVQSPCASCGFNSLVCIATMHLALSCKKSNSNYANMISIRMHAGNR